MHIGKIEIQQDQLGKMDLRQLDAGLTSGRMEQFERWPKFQDSLHQSEIHEIVFDVENVAGDGWNKIGCALRAGRSGPPIRDS